LKIGGLAGYGRLSAKWTDAVRMAATANAVLAVGSSRKNERFALVKMEAHSQ
jgi:hypothetical protein